MRIAFISNEYPPHARGGIGVFTWQMAHALHNAGNPITVITNTGPVGEWDDDGIRVVRLAPSRIPRVPWMIDRWRLYACLRREIHRGSIDCIEAMSFKGWLPFPMPDCPTFVRLHASTLALQKWVGNKSDRGSYICEKAMLLYHPRWIGVSRYSLRLTSRLYGLEPYRQAVIYNPVTLEDDGKVDAPPLPERFLLYAGNVSKKKGAYILADAARIFLQRYKDLHLVFAGALLQEDGLSPQERLRELLESPLGARIHFLGLLNRATLFDCMRRALAFVQPSLMETFGIAVAEAMACGTPVIVSGLGPFREFVYHGENGLVVAPRPKPVADAVSQVVEQPEASRTLGSKGQAEVAKRFSLERCVSETLLFYEQTIANWPAERSARAKKRR